MDMERWFGLIRRGRWGIWAIALTVSVLLLAGIDLGVRAAIVHGVVVTGDAEWIWDEPAPAGRDSLGVPADPAAFYALDDFDLTEVPPSVELQIRGDEEYLVWVNGVFLGGEVYAEVEQGSVDVYEIAPILELGKNWVVVEARSRRPVGGLLCRVHAGGETLTATGESWRIESRFINAALGAEPSSASAGPHVWSQPPVGRWGLPRRERRMAPISERLAGSAPVAAAQWSRRDSGVWRPVRPAQQRTRAQGTWVTFDWGRVVEGHLALRRIVSVGAGETAPARALVLFGEAPPDARQQARGELPADEIALFVPDSPRWMSARPVRFRYATVLGLDSITAAAAIERTPGTTIPASTASAGVLGFEPALLRTAVENEVRRELENVLGVAAR